MADHPLPAVGRRTLQYVLGALIGLLFVASCRMDGTLSLSPEEQSWLKAHQGDLTVLLEEDLPPFVFRNEDGIYDGLFVDYLHEIEKKTGQRFTIQSFAIWSDLLTHAQKDHNFIILCINRTEARSRYLLFTDPVIKIPYAIVARKTTPATPLSGFVGKKLCTVNNYAVNNELARYYPQIPPFGVRNSTRGLHAVSSGTCDGMVINLMEATYLIENLGLTNLQIVDQTHFRDRPAIATSIRDPMLFSIVEKSLDAVKPGRKREIYHHWVNIGHEVLPESLVVGVEIVAGIVFSLLFLLWAWTTSLRQVVKQQTRQIRASREKLRITLDSIGDGVMTTDTQGRITRLNPIAEALTGWTLQEARDKSLAEVIQLKDVLTQKPLPPPDLPTCEKGKTKETTSEAILVSRSGEHFQIHFNVSPIRDEEKNSMGIVFSFKDITDKVNAEEELLRIKKLDSLGILAGGIAHDFNNLLTGLYGNISLAKMALPDNHEALGYLMSAEESMEAAVALTGQFLTFSKNEKPVRRVIAMGKTLSEAATFAAHGLNTQLETRIADDLWPVSADKGQLNQVVGNLIINAHQAMTTGGIISLTAENIAKPSGRHVRITVKDTGTGIPPEHLEKIFDPYFTTKKTGSGLGLATTHAIVAKHNGTIKVDSTLGKGTTFTIDLPATAEPLPPPLDEKLEALIDTHALRAHILVLDDQAVIRKILETILKKMGFEVTFTVEGSETVAAYAQRLREGTPFDAVILDLTIPGGMGGREASEKILAMDPKARLIISSGYASDPIMANYKAHGIKAIAVKPYRFSDFQEILLRVLLNT